MLPLIIKNREAAIVASNIFLSCFFSRKSIASSTLGHSLNITKSAN